MEEQLECLHRELREALLLPDSVQRDAVLSDLVTATAELQHQAAGRRTKRELCKVLSAMGAVVAFLVATMLLAMRYG